MITVLIEDMVDGVVINTTTYGIQKEEEEEEEVAPDVSDGSERGERNKDRKGFKSSSKK